MAILLITVLYRRSRSDAAPYKEKAVPSVARVIELSATSEESFEDAINMAVNRATSTLRNVEGDKSSRPPEGTPGMKCI